MDYSDFNGDNFTECVVEVIGNMGASNVLYRLLEELESCADKDMKSEILNYLWTM